MKKCIPFAASLILLVTACDRNKSGSSTGSQGDSGLLSADAASGVIAPERLGFASRLPKSAEFYIALHNPSEVLNALAHSDVGELLFQLDDSKDASADEQEEMMAKLKEFMIADAFLCIDDGAAWQIGLAGECYQEINSAQIKLVAQIFLRVLNGLGKGDINPEGEPYAELMDAFDDDAEKLFKNVIEQLDAKLDDFTLPSVYMGCSPPVGKTKEWLGIWNESIQAACEEEFIEPHGFEKYGAHFSGFRINLGGMIEDAQAEQDNKAEGDDEQLPMPKSLEDEFERITEKFKSMSVTVVCGEVDGRLLLYAGPDAASLVLVDKAEDSLVSRQEFEQFGGMNDSRLLGVCYASDTFIKSFQTWRGHEKSYRALAEAFGNEKLPESEKIIEKFNALADLEQELIKCEIDPFLMVCALDEGLRIETVGGRHGQSLDYHTPLRLPMLTDAMGDDLFMRMHWMGDRARKEKQLDYVELLVGAAGQILQSGFLAFADENGDGAEWYEKSKQMYEEVVDPEVTRLWTAYRESFRPSLGSETAVIVDINGEMPRVPGVPSDVLKEGRIPRILYVRPVEDRAKLEEAYGAVETTAKNLLEYASILSETELPMPDFLSAQKDDLTTWFYPFPTLTNDFVPGVSVSDTLLLVGSSKNFAEDTYSTWKKRGASQQDYTGMLIDIQFKPLWDATGQWIELAEKEHAKAKSKEALKAFIEDKDFSENEEADKATDYESARKILQHMRSLDSFHWHRRMENGMMRSTMRVNISGE